MTEKFRLYEVVIVETDDADLADINGFEGHITGIYDNGENPTSYNVRFYQLTDDIAREIPEMALISTGKIGKKEDHYPGDSIRVRPDGSVVHSDDI